MHQLLQFFERQSLRTKLTTGFTVWLALLIVLNASSIHIQQQLQVQMEHSYETDLIGISNTKDVQTQAILLGRCVRQALLASDTKQRDDAIRQIAQVRAQAKIHLNTLHQQHLPSNTQEATSATSTS